MILKTKNICYKVNRLLPSSKNPHFQNEATCTTFLVKMSFIYMRMKNNFHIKGLALNLVLIQRHGETRKSPIEQPRNIILCYKGRLWDTIVLGCSQFTLYNLLVVSLHGLIVEKYGAALREMRFTIQAWTAPSYPYITYLLFSIVFQLYLGTCARTILFLARSLFVYLFNWRVRSVR